MATHAPGLSRRIRQLAPLDDVEFADTALPTFRDNRSRIDSARRTAGASTAGLVAKFTSVHSALPQYTAPGTRRLVGTGKVSFEFRIPW